MPTQPVSSDDAADLFRPDVAVVAVRRWRHASGLQATKEAQR
jgi:hypothetical protein